MPKPDFFRSPVPVSWRQAVLAALAVVGVIFAPPPGYAAPSADLWPRWQAHDAASTQRIHHSDWDQLLSAYLKSGSDGVHRFDYAALKTRDRPRLEAYLSRLSGTPISEFNRNEQFAYWMNLYNALTVKVVVDHFPVKSISDIDISPGVFANGPWGAKLVTVEGEPLSLDDIEHRILRPIWRDPRIHYAVNCAAIGCPNLNPVAFTADNTEPMLDKAAVAYVNDPRGARFDGNDLVVSSIYAWFEEDFGSSEAGVLRHLKRYARPPLSGPLEGRDGYSDHTYDWSLNGVSAAES